MRGGTIGWRPGTAAGGREESGGEARAIEAFAWGVQLVVCRQTTEQSFLNFAGARGNTATRAATSSGGRGGGRGPENTEAAVHDGVRCQPVAEAILSCRKRMMGERLREAIAVARARGLLTPREAACLRKEIG